jgi:hypothetical protein
MIDIEWWIYLVVFAGLVVGSVLATEANRRGGDPAADDRQRRKR